MTALIVLAFVAIAVLALIVFGLLRTHADILRALDRAGISLENHISAPNLSDIGRSAALSNRDIVDIVGTVPGGGSVSVSVVGNHYTLLAFLSSSCRTCERFWSELTTPDFELGGQMVRLVIVAQDPAHDSESRLAELAPPGVRTVCASAAWQAYQVSGSPYFVLIDGPKQQIVGAGTAADWRQVRRLMSAALGDEKIAKMKFT